jgi:hypothetical protein
LLGGIDREDLFHKGKYCDQKANPCLSACGRHQLEGVGGAANVAGVETDLIGLNFACGKRVWANVLVDAVAEGTRKSTAGSKTLSIAVARQVGNHRRTHGQQDHRAEDANGGGNLE